MVIEVPEKFEAALKMRAQAKGVSPEGLVWTVMERELADLVPAEPLKPFKTGRGMLAKYGPAPSAEEIDEVRAEMWKNFGKWPD